MAGGSGVGSRRHAATMLLVAIASAIARDVRSLVPPRPPSSPSPVANSIVLRGFGSGDAGTVATTTNRPIPGSGKGGGALRLRRLRRRSSMTSMRRIDEDDASMISSTTSMTRGRELRRDASSRCDGALSATVDDRRSFLRRNIFASTAFAVSSYAMPPIIPPSYALESSSSESTLSSTSSSSESTASKSNVAVSRGTDDDGDCSFKSGAYGIEEYTNTIVASRDTNVSPREVYDTISSEYLRGAASSVMSTSMEEEGDGRTIRRRRSPRALDVGAGAGVSTQVLYDMGYHRIDAIDWSSTAWDRYVTNDPNGRCPNGVKFYEMDDERYLEMWRREMAYRRRPRRDENDADADADADGISFDAVVFNFAVNRSKAIRFATELLDKEHGRLLAPINSYDDYWLSQIYTVMDGYGNVLWSAADVGAWSVLFQPDVTQDTCSGIWCSQFNGFQKR